MRQYTFISTRNSRAYQHIDEFQEKAELVTACGTINTQLLSVYRSLSVKGQACKLQTASVVNSIQLPSGCGQLMQNAAKTNLIATAWYPWRPGCHPLWGSSLFVGCVPPQRAPPPTGHTPCRAAKLPRPPAALSRARSHRLLCMRLARALLPRTYRSHPNRHGNHPTL